MTEVQKYRAYLFIVLAGSLYILLTEGWGRWESALGEWASLGEKATKVMSSDEASKRKLALQTELGSLRGMLATNAHGFDQSEAGLVELVGESAKKEGLNIETLTPTKLESGDGLNVSIDALGSFHKIAGFLNTLETSLITIKVEKIELTRGSGRGLHMNVSLKATFLRSASK